MSYSSCSFVLEIFGLFGPMVYLVHGAFWKGHRPHSAVGCRSCQGLNVRDPPRRRGHPSMRAHPKGFLHLQIPKRMRLLELPGLGKLMSTAKWLYHQITFSQHWAFSAPVIQSPGSHKHLHSIWSHVSIAVSAPALTTSLAVGGR